MYDLLDRPVTMLHPFEGRILDATRRWVHALVMRGTAADTGRDPFSRVMDMLDRGSRDDLAISRPCAPLVAEAEAVLLGLWRLVRDGRLDGARATAALIVGGGADALVAAMEPLALA